MHDSIQRGLRPSKCNGNWLNSSINEEFQTPEKVRLQVVDTILTQGIELLRSGEDSEVLENLVLDLNASSGDHEAFESWCDQDLPMALDSVRSDLKPTRWAWKQLVDSIREDPPF